MDSSGLFKKKEAWEENTAWNAVEKQEEATEQRTELNAFEEGMEELERAGLKIGGVNYKDGKKMLEVKEKMRNIANDLRSPIQEATFDTALQIMIGSLESLTRSCNHFTSDVFLTASGKRRKAFVQALEKRAEILKQSLSERGRWAWDKLGQSGERRDWSNILNVAGVHIVKCAEENLIFSIHREDEHSLEEDRGVISKGKNSVYHFEKEIKVAPPKMEVMIPLQLSRLTENNKVNFNKLEQAYETDREKVFRFCRNMDGMALRTENNEDNYAAMLKVVSANIAAQEMGIKFKNEEVLKEFFSVIGSFQTGLQRFDAKKQEYAQAKESGMQEGQSISACRVLASRMESLLKMNAHANSELINQCQRITLITNQNEEMLGVISRWHEKKRTWRISGLKEYTPGFIKDLCNLQIFDAITGSMPRNMDDLIFKEDRKTKKYNSVLTTDQKISFTKADSVAGYHGLIQNGKFIQPYVEKEMAAELDNLWQMTNHDYSAFQLEFGDYLAEAEIKALADRIHELHEAITEAVKEGATTVVSEFTEEMVRKLLANKNSYVVKAMKDIHADILLEEVNSNQEETEEKKEYEKGSE